jgi:peptide/nickel transport system substrate-binding protein
MTRHWLPARARYAASLMAAIAAAGMLAACSSGHGSSAGGGSSAGPSGTITGSFTSAPYTADFNPYSPGNLAIDNGMIYEPLMFFDTAQSGSVQPWLATGYTWGSGGRSLTFTLRHNVTWNDGKPFTSADVAYTFNLEKSSTTANQYGLPIAGVTTNGRYSVTVSFTRPVYTDLWFIAGKTMMLPQHVWSTIKDPMTWTNPHPVGTGAYLVSKVTPQVLILTANTHYYMPGLPRVKTYEFPVYTNNNTADAAIETGQVDWGGGFVPNINQTYLAKNPRYHLVDIPLAEDYLIPNMVKGPTTSLALRQAISAALDRSYMSQSVYNGYGPATNPEALLMPNFKNVASPQTQSDQAAGFGGADPARSKQILQAAGYKMGGNGIFDAPGGQALNLDVKVVSGWTDFQSLLQIMQQELKAAGIGLTITQEAYSVWLNDQYTGNFQLLMSNGGYTPIPYNYYYDLLDSAVTRPIGTAETIGNFGRYHNPTVDNLLNTIATTTDAAAQDQAFYQIESIVKQQLPVIPLMEAQDEIEFNGNHVANFPTTSNPWSGAAPWLQPDCGWLAARLAPVK